MQIIATICKKLIGPTTMLTSIFTDPEFQMLIVSFLYKMFSAVCALGLIAVCEYIGAKMYKINLREALDKVEANPDAFSLYCTGRFIGACIILAVVIG